MNRPLKSAYKFTRSPVTAAVLAIPSGCVRPHPCPLHTIDAAEEKNGLDTRGRRNRP